MALLLLSARNRWHFFSGVSGKDFDTVSLLQSRLKSARTMQNGALLVIISELVAPSLGGQKRLFQRVSTWKCGYFLIRFLLSFWFACAAIIKATHASFASKVRLNLQEAKNNELDPLVTLTEPVVFLFGGQMRICQRIARMWSLFHSFITLFCSVRAADIKFMHASFAAAAALSAVSFLQSRPKSSRTMALLLSWRNRRRLLSEVRGEPFKEFQDGVRSFVSLFLILLLRRTD